MLLSRLRFGDGGIIALVSARAKESFGGFGCAACETWGVGLFGFGESLFNKSHSSCLKQAAQAARSWLVDLNIRALPAFLLSCFLAARAPHCASRLPFHLRFSRFRFYFR
jgi:hypothetical protein